MPCVRRWCVVNGAYIYLRYYCCLRVFVRTLQENKLPSPDSLLVRNAQMGHTQT